jgi:hypothetical protein
VQSGRCGKGPRRTPLSPSKRTQLAWSHAETLVASAGERDDPPDFVGCGSAGPVLGDGLWTNPWQWCSGLATINMEHLVLNRFRDGISKEFRFGAVGAGYVGLETGGVPFSPRVPSDVRRQGQRARDGAERRAPTTGYNSTRSSLRRRFSEWEDRRKVVAMRARVRIAIG